VAVVVTIMNMKGGVGKTTVAVHLAGLLSSYDVGGKSYLLKGLSGELKAKIGLDSK
jgi:cellulose biosynthesis protein BcsQ